MRTSRVFPHATASVTAARHLARELLAGSPLEVAEAVEIMVSELATNSIRHTSSGFTLDIDIDDDRVRVDVTDDGTGEVTLRSPDLMEPSGRGLRIVELLSDAWGVEPATDGKTVWFSLRLAPGSVRSA